MSALELTASRDLYLCHTSTVFTVSFLPRDDTLEVRIRSKYLDQAARNVTCTNVVAVAFYPFTLYPGACVYVMTLWQQSAGGHDPLTIHHPFLHFTDNLKHPADLHPPRSAARRALRFSQSEVDSSLQSWATGLGWRFARSPAGYLVASRQQVRPTQIQPAAPDMSEALAAWRCPICQDDMQEDRDLVSAHDAPKGSDGKQVLHVFHRHCLNTWHTRDRDSLNPCPICRAKLAPQPPQTRWVPGNTTVQARMDTNPFIVSHHLWN
jgi:hypothetical protein